eukprot:5279595-Amphidinium_carterae.1
MAEAKQGGRGGQTDQGDRGSSRETRCFQGGTGNRYPQDQGAPTGYRASAQAVAGHLLGIIICVGA